MIGVSQGAGSICGGVANPYIHISSTAYYGDVVLGGQSIGKVDQSGNCSAGGGSVKQDMDLSGLAGGMGGGGVPAGLLLNLN